MQILQTFNPKEMVALTPGELFVANDGGRALCIAMQADPSQMLLMAVVLSSADERPHPFWTRFNSEADCFSYGSAWVLDLDDGREACPGQFADIDSPGTIIVSPAGVSLRANNDGQSIQNRPATFDLGSFGLSRRSADLSSSVCIRSWTIWINEAERLRQGSRPLFEFTGQPAM